MQRLFVENPQNGVVGLSPSDDVRAPFGMDPVFFPEPVDLCLRIAGVRIDERNGCFGAASGL